MMLENLCFECTKRQLVISYAMRAFHYQVQRYEEALDAYMHVLLLDPSLAYVYNLKGFVLLKLRRSEEAFDAFSKARATFEFRIHRHPTDAEAYIGKGLALYGLNRQLEALFTFD